MGWTYESDITLRNLHVKWKPYFTL